MEADQYALGDTHVQFKVLAARNAQLLADPNLRWRCGIHHGAEHKWTVRQ
jgi:hypothetical protein